MYRGNCILVCTDAYIQYLTCYIQLQAPNSTSRESWQNCEVVWLTVQSEVRALQSVHKRWWNRLWRLFAALQFVKHDALDIDKVQPVSEVVNNSGKHGVHTSTVILTAARTERVFQPLQVGMSHMEQVWEQSIIRGLTNFMKVLIISMWPTGDHYIW